MRVNIICGPFQFKALRVLLQHIFKKVLEIKKKKTSMWSLETTSE